MLFTNKAYTPWKIKPSEFPKSKDLECKIKFLLRYALLAPSSHNAQPWNYNIKNNTVLFSPNLNRLVPMADKDSRFIYVGLGCTYKNFEVAAKAYGFTISKKIVNGSVTKIEAKVTEANSITKIDKIALDALTGRVTNRNSYTKQTINKNILDDFTNLAEKYGLKIIFVTDKQKKEQIIKLTEKGDYLVWTDPDFQDEHLRWVRHNLTAKHDGMPAFTVGIPLIASFFARPVIKNLPFAKFQAMKNRKLLLSTPYFAFILSQKHDNDTWIKVGEALEEIWLKATTEKLSIAPLVQIVEVNNLYQESAAILGTKLRPEFFFRLGYAKKEARHSPRLNLEETVIK